MFLILLNYLNIRWCCEVYLELLMFYLLMSNICWCSCLITICDLSLFITSLCSSITGPVDILAISMSTSACLCSLGIELLSVCNYSLAYLLLPHKNTSIFSTLLQNTIPYSFLTQYSHSNRSNVKK